MEDLKKQIREDKLDDLKKKGGPKGYDGDKYDYTLFRDILKAKRRNAEIKEERQRQREKMMRKAKAGMSKQLINLLPDENGESVNLKQMHANL